MTTLRWKGSSFSVTSTFANKSEININSCAIMMDVPEDYNTIANYCRTHPKILPTDDKENLDLSRSSKRPLSSSRSMLKNIDNQNKLLVVLK